MTELAAAPQRRFGPHQGAITVVQEFQEVWSYRGVLWNIAWTQIHAGYRGSFLGILWTVLIPLSMMGIYAFVFGSILGRDIPNFALFIITGMVSFGVFQSSCTTGCRSLTTAEIYLRRVYLPKLIFPSATLIVQAVNFACTLAAVLLLMPLLGARPSIHWIVLPVGIVLLLLFCYGVIMLVATINVYIRDLEHATTALLRMWYFLTPIIYSSEHVGGKVEIVNNLNPLTYYLDLFRSPMYYNIARTDNWPHSGWPDGQTWLITITCSVVVFLVGLIVFRLFENKVIYAM
ncbi:MAG: ABC transporter permease [Phycisphaerales bacterium]|nr:ABC transporter permease [Phycisphaerales bacterium]